MPAWLAGLLAAALLLAQGTGLWHRVAHTRVLPGAESGLTQRPAGPGPGLSAADRWFGHAAGAHGGGDCLWFDHLACGEAAWSAPAVWLAADALPGPPRIPQPGRWKAPVRLPFQARAPPGVLDRYGMQQGRAGESTPA